MLLHHYTLLGITYCIILYHDANDITVICYIESGSVFYCVNTVKHDFPLFINEVYKLLSQLLLITTHLTMSCL